MGKIVWLASYPKSGSTWLRAFLHNLMRDSARPHDINRLGELTAGDVDAAAYEALAGKPAAGLSFDEVLALRAPVQRRLAAEAPDSRFVKTHSAILQIRGHPTIDLGVTAGAIYVVRDPRDVAVSFSHHLGEPIDRIVTLMATENSHTGNEQGQVADFIGSWSQHVASWTARPHPGLHVMRYEDMLSSPSRSFGALVGFLGLQPSRERLERALRHASFKVLRNQEARHGFREKTPQSERFFRSGRAGDWRGALTPEQARRIEADHGPQMHRFDYLARDGAAG